jgi:mono/diheme cytochrome c family protein
MTFTRRAATTIAMAGWLAAAWSMAASAQTTGTKNPPLIIASMRGGDLFNFYCASCHGSKGRGDGPMAPALKTAPANLTMLTSRHGGKYPAEYVRSVITSGTQLASSSHGSSAMPVWGPIFHALESDDTRVPMRIDNLVAYIESIQTK